MVTQADGEGDGRRHARGLRAPARARRVCTAGAGYQCLPSKLRPPRAHVELVDRAALVARLLTSTEPFVLVSAPAGSGKTVALTQWVRAETRPATWLCLDGNDNDPLGLLRCLAVALDRVITVEPELIELLQLRDPPLNEQVLPGLAAAVASAAPFVLVLDDAQLVQNEEAWGHIAVVLENLPEGARLAVATRSEPPLPLGRLRARGELLELRYAELAFDCGEASSLLRLHGAGEGDADAVAALLEATEGWATGLYLASLTARGRSPEEWLAQVRGDQQAIADYLLGEVLERQPADLQRFLLETSLLDELTAPVCAAVTGRAGAGAVLARLARENLFVSALDDHDERFRYHHLFADLLRSRLERDEPGVVAELHRRAATWYEAHAEPEPAIRHYLAAGDVEATVDLAVLAADRLFLVGLVESARRLLLLYTEEQLLRYPALAVEGGWIFALAAGTREEQAHWGRLMASLDVEDQPSPLAHASLRASWLIVVAELAAEGLTQARRCFEGAWRLERDTPGDWRNMAHDGLARAYYLAGSTARAAAMFRERVTSVVGVDADAEEVAGAHCWLALIAEDDGRWEEAEEHMREARRQWPRLGLDDPTHHSGWLGVLLPHLRLMSHAGDPDTMSFAHAIDDYTAEMVHNAPWVLLHRDVVLGEVALEQGDLAAARGWSDRALKTLAGWPDAGICGRRAKKLADALDRRVIAEPITPAERRVLELLPTHLKTANLAERLFLSQNTVKAHLRSIYRKLDAGSREEAVERARELGVLRR